MSLETLRGVTKIGGFQVFEIDKGSPRYKLADDGEIYPVFIDHENNVISFKIQDGPVKEHGVNGCQVDTMMHAAKEIISGLNNAFPSDHNERAIAHLQCAINALDDRKAEREKRGVEGYSKE